MHDHGEAVEAEAEGEAGGGVGIEERVATRFVDGGEHGGIDHAAAGDFDPAGFLALRFEFHVDFKARLGEGEEVRTEAHGGAGAENLAEEVFERAFEVTEADVLIDVEAFELVEDAEVRGVDFIATIGCAGSNDAHGERLGGFHGANLHAGRVRAQQAAIRQVKSILLVASRMIGRRVQRIEAMPLGFNLGSFCQCEAHAAQRADSEIANLCERMQRANASTGTPRQCDVDAFNGLGVLRGLLGEFLGLDAISDGGAHFVELGTDFLFLIDRNVLHASAQRGDAAFFAEEVHAHGFERGFILRGIDGDEGFGFESVELGEHGE